MTVLAVVMFSTACEFQSGSRFSPTAPTSGAGSGGGATNSGGSLLGTWASLALNASPSSSTCGNLQWQITSQTTASLAGTFSAVCGGIATVSGSASGRFNDSTTIVMNAIGSAVVAGVTCDFSLDATGHVETSDSIRIDYAGTTCLGPVRGTETLRRSSPSPAPAPPDPTPDPPAPPPPPDPLFGCGGISDKPDLVECIRDAINPRDAEGAFEVSKRVAWALRGEGAGLLIKNAGENIVSWHGYSFSASRICYPDGHIYKVISDAGPGGANGASWQDNGFVDRKLYVPAIDPTL